MTFDIAVLQLLFPLAAGGYVCISSEGDCASDIAGAIVRFNATWLATTPSVARTLSPVEVPLLQTLELGGEPMLPVDITTWIDHVDLRVSYGPAECAIMVSSDQITDLSIWNLASFGRTDADQFQKYLVDPTPPASARLSLFGQIDPPRDQGNEPS